MICLPPGEIDAKYVDSHVRPLFAQTLARTRGAYLANHSLGRPLDRMEDDVAEFARLWVEEMDGAWGPWLEEARSFAAGISSLIGLPHVVPKASCGQALRAVLNSLGECPNVVASTGEFDSVDFILRVYRQQARAQVTWVPPVRSVAGVPIYECEALADAVRPGVDLVLVSAVMFATGQVMEGLEGLRQRAHEVGARVLVDTYHAAGVIPLDLASFDYAIGGCYKYLRGGPGACWLALSEERVHDRTPDTGWFAKRDPFAYARLEEPEWGAGADAWRESTPAVAPLYQARSGLEFTLAAGAGRLRKHSLEMLARVRELLAPHGGFLTEDPAAWGAFALWPVTDPEAEVARLKVRGVNVDARQGLVRFGPDVLTTEEDLARLAAALNHC